MQKVLIIGCGGAGKSELARKLGAITGLPVIHLDALFWNPGWVATERPVWREKIAELLKQDTWIMDGNYANTYDLRFPAADTIIFMNFSRWTCLYRVYKRRFMYHRKTRPDLAPGCPEQVDWEFAKWIWRFPKDIVPRVREGFKNTPAKVIELRNQKEADEFISKLETK